MTATVSGKCLERQIMSETEDDKQLVLVSATQMIDYNNNFLTGFLPRSSYGLSWKVTVYSLEKESTSSCAGDTPTLV